MRKKFFETMFLTAGFFLVPFLAHADIEISEVAWMGTSDSQYEEWIELYNSGSSTSLEGFKIYKAGGGTTLISLSGTISAGQYFLVCRTTPSVPNPLGGACDVSAGFGGSGLNNSSEHILLKDGGGATVDEGTASSGWPAGSSSSKETMQKSGSGWITATGTPGSANAASGSGNGITNQEEEETEEEVASEEDEAVEELPERKIYSTRILKIEAPKIAIVGSPVHFKAQALDYDRSDIFKGHYSWNMGNGVTRDFALGYRETNDGFDYVYDHPGSYTVSVKYFTGFLKDVPAALEERFTVEVVSATVVISKVYPDGGIELKNTSGSSIDLSGWQIRDTSGKIFLVPNDTHLAAGKTVVFSNKVTKLNTFGSIDILTPTNTSVFSWPVKMAYVGSVSKSVKIEKKEEITTPPGEVLGVGDSLEDKSKENSNSNGTVWILLFIILILLAVIAVMFLRKVEKTEEDSYELLDE